MRAHGFDWDWWRRLADHGLSFGAGAHVSDCIVGNGYVVAPGATLRGAIVANEPEPEPAAR